jgi:hypothetical protein
VETLYGAGFTAAEMTAVGGMCRVVFLCMTARSGKPSYNAGLSNADSTIRVKINASNYFSNAGNSIIRGLPNTL